MALSNAVPISVYKITCTSNGKLYIGVTSKPLSVRLKRHVAGAASSSTDKTHFAMAIKKYGKECFLIESLEENLTRAEAIEREQYYIAFYKTMDRTYGYNSAPGGEGVGAEYWTEEARSAHATKLRAKWTPERKAAAAEAARARWADPEMRTRYVTGIKQAMSAPEMSEKIRAAMPPMSAENRENVSRSVRKYFSDPENRKRIGDKARLAWEELHSSKERVAALETENTELKTQLTVFREENTELKARVAALEQLLNKNRPPS